MGLDTAVLGLPLYSAFYIVLNLLEGKRWHETKNELKVKLLPTFVLGAGFWIPAQTINFRFIPPHMRVSYIAFCTFIELNILAFIKHLDVAKF